MNYDPEDGATVTEYVSPKEKTGWEEDQKFILNNYKKNGYGWRVLGCEELSGQIMLISDECVGPKNDDENSLELETSYILYGETGYKNAIEELNNICDIYGQGKYEAESRSRTVEDINKIT